VWVFDVRFLLRACNGYYDRVKLISSRFEKFG